MLDARAPVSDEDLCGAAMKSLPASAHVLILASYAPSLLNFRGPLIRAVLAAGHRVSVGAPDIAPALRARLETMGAEVHDTPLRRTGTGILADLRYCAGLRRLITRIHPDIVLTYTIKPNIWGAFAARHAGVPVVAMVTGLGYAFTDSGHPSLRQRIVQGVARFLYRIASSCNTRVIFQNPDDRDDFCAAGCLVDFSKIGMVDGSGVDMAHYARRSLPDEPVFLMITRLLRNKGVREYAEASLRILRQNSSLRCLLAGPFDEGPDGISKADLDRWIAGGLEYLGPLDDVRPALARARIYVLPSYREGTPRSVLEAMSVGRAVITTDAPGCREAVRDGIEGYLVPVRDSQALAAAMQRMLEHPEQTAVMAEAAFRRAKEKYDVHTINRQMMSLLGLGYAGDRTEYDEQQEQYDQAAD
jgi:glycosyltransferase involved in cell wall biosynthesis